MNAAAVAAALPHLDCVDALDPAMQAVSRRDATLPLRQYMAIPGTDGGKFTSMPGYLADPRSFGIKLVAKYPRSDASPLGSHTGAVVLFDADAGAPIAMLDGSELTAIRTAAASALATRALARPTRACLPFWVPVCRPAITRWRLPPSASSRRFGSWGRRPEKAAALAAGLLPPATATTSLDAALAGADMSATTTSAREPVLGGDQLEAGQHVNLVGAAIIEASEVDAHAVERSRVIVDYRESALAQAGEIAAAIAAGRSYDDVVAGELGEVLAGTLPGRQSAEQITLYKSLGVSAQDLAAAVVALRNAEASDLGVHVDW